jgi:hypothetical protein
MPVNLEVKGMLARLLATEDIVVEHKKVETACFNVHTRVLTLPMWEKASNNIYDLLVAHECGHSIHTPDEDWTEQVKVPPQFVNVVEDARIEKLMKRRYAGLAKTFFTGYKELNDEDFFQLENEDTSTYNLADRANLYFKVGNFLSLNFTVEEWEIIDQIGTAETFSEALDAAEVLYKYCKQKQQEETKINLDSHEIPQSGGNSPASDFSDQQEVDNDQPEIESGDGASSDQTGEQKSQEQQQKQKVKSEQGGETSEPEVKTVGNLEKALKDLVNRDGWENVYLEIPKLNVNQIIVNNIEIHNQCKQSWASYLDHTEYSHEEIFGEVDKDFREFKRSAQKEVNYLVKEFECRKAADSYARATTARTGVLDCSKLHTYKYNEDLFRKVTTLANGKNHGLVFILDWSGSMSRVMLDTVKQLFNLIWFCKKVNIPFEVYAFTNDYPVFKYDRNNTSIMSQPLYQKKDGSIHIAEHFSLMNMFTSKINGKTLEDQMLNIYRIARSFSDEYYSRYAVPVGLSLSGTPLNESLVALHEILPIFQKENKLQKVQCVILTDGEAAPLKYHKEFNRRHQSEPYLGLNSICSNAFLRDRKTGNTYSLDVEWFGFTDILLHNLRDKFPTVNFIGMRILESRDANNFIRRYTGYIGTDYDKITSSWKKEKTFSIKNSGYHTYFGLSASALANDTEFEVAENATKTQIKTAFVKSLRSKKMNKKVLGEFVELVA